MSTENDLEYKGPGCEHCKFYKHEGTSEDIGGYGYCRRRAPNVINHNDSDICFALKGLLTAFIVSREESSDYFMKHSFIRSALSFDDPEDRYSIWPTVWADDWCGEWVVRMS